MLFSLILGCWKVDDELHAIDMTEVPYDNAYLQNDATIRMLDLELTCPDGNPDRLFSLYVDGADAASPVAIVLHSGPFDYVKVRDEGSADVLAGEHYHLVSRLDRAWSNDKVWETLGLARTEVDPPEVNFGTLPTALLNAGFIVLLPGNCWGDLWHGEEGVQEGDPDLDGFERNGLAVAWQTVEMLTDPAVADENDFEVPVPWNDELYLVGLGEGGRGVTELLLHDGMPAVDGILVDSSPDDLQPYLDDPILWADEVEGLERIFGDDASKKMDLSDYTLSHVADLDLLPERVAYLWSSLDPRIPDAATRPFAALTADRARFWVRDFGVEQHVLTNSDPELAESAADYLLTGNLP